MAGTQCSGCGSWLAAEIHGRKRYCSEKCRRSAKTRARAARLKASQPGSRSVRRGFTCQSCGVFTARTIGDKDAGKYCSMACYQSMLARRRNGKVASLTHRPCSGGCGLLIVGYADSKRTCLQCKTAAQRERRSRWKRTENGAANRRKAHSMRRAILRGVKVDKVDPIRVFDRDEWKCYLCGGEIPRDEKWPSALFGTLDHVVPLSKGGEHSYANVRAAHLSCNCRKGNKL